MRYWQIILSLITWNVSNALAQSPGDVQQSVEELPGVEMLEFLSEWEALDDETWQILEQHALQDVSSQVEKTR